MKRSVASLRRTHKYSSTRWMRYALVVLTATNLVTRTNICRFVGQTLNSPALPPFAQKRYLRLLYRTCGHHAIIPSALKVVVDCSRTGVALYRGGYADVWKGRCSGRDVAVKVIRVYSNDVLQKVINVSYWHCSVPPSPVPTTLCVEILQGSCDVEIPSTSKCPATNGSGDGGK